MKLSSSSLASDAEQVTTFAWISFRGWSGRELARWLAVGDTGLKSLGFPRAAMFGCRSVLLFQLPPIEPGMRFSRTRLTDALHLRCSAGARQDRFGLGATTMPLRETRPRFTGDR
jgi:hypothetical protein